jgi:hypothetical protein
VSAKYGDTERQIIMERHLRHQATPLKDLGARFGLSRPVRGARAADGGESAQGDERDGDCRMSKWKECGRQAKG